MRPLLVLIATVAVVATVAACATVYLQSGHRVEDSAAATAPAASASTGDEGLRPPRKR